jgi:DnaJ domain
MAATEGRPGLESKHVEAFRLLGIPAGSDREAVVHAYRRLARATHPDVSADPEAADRFAALTAAYRLLFEVPSPDADPAPAVRPGRQTRASMAEGEDLGDDWPAPGWAFGDGWPMRISPGVPARPLQRPPIIAGPVRVRPPRSGARGKVRDG